MLPFVEREGREIKEPIDVVTKMGTHNVLPICEGLSYMLVGSDPHVTRAAVSINANTFYSHKKTTNKLKNKGLIILT